MVRERADLQVYALKDILEHPVNGKYSSKNENTLFNFWQSIINWEGAAGNNKENVTPNYVKRITKKWNQLNRFAVSPPWDSLTII